MAIVFTAVQAKLACINEISERLTIDFVNNEMDWEIIGPLKKVCIRIRITFLKKQTPIIADEGSDF
ncbi:hypothetical protein PKF023_13600 [Polynucleobacter yangtzensis]|uniref:Uncharacterized protein n=1 Tax=Polynucleobacter yangtzensis TaxID=1743159 RepID=A0A9C7CFI6_9BURK|nr:hypothetical protein PKF023_13600 [Polynucleobacter yangtzensis]BDT79418.1 hypothetical protein PKF032_13060 [Polynucleobacter yangtzensis]